MITNYEHLYGEGIHEDDPFFSYEAMRLDQMGDDYPPYNSTATPQVTFAFIDACNSGGSGNFLSIIYPYFIYDFEATTDQAVLTWGGYCSANKAAKMNQELWGRLADMYTVQEAIVDMIHEQEGLSRSQQWFIISFDNATFQAVDSVDEVPILGDPYTRIHGLYTGGNGLPDGIWWN
jgi:hypothetical protein